MGGNLCVESSELFWILYVLYMRSNCKLSIEWFLTNWYASLLLLNLGRRVGFRKVQRGNSSIRNLKWRQTTKIIRPIWSRCYRPKLPTTTTARESIRWCWRIQLSGRRVSFQWLGWWWRNRSGGIIWCFFRWRGTSTTRASKRCWSANARSIIVPGSGERCFERSSFAISIYE